MTLWLVRANDEGVCFCKCRTSLASVPGAGQADCPWCGCGWLFSCIRCRKAFTFAAAVDVDISLSDIVALDVDSYGADTPSEIAHETNARHELAKKLRLKEGAEHVVLDGTVLATSAPVDMTGIYGRHVLPEPLQVTHRGSPSRMGDALGRGYWAKARAAR